ncbi:hypothetical protein [Nocardia sp. NPDC005825]|uniref:hypothetical protein n=1 Tax=unclassified Nocardia TaxID=2637762 RepID=UPI0033D28B10
MSRMLTKSLATAALSAALLGAAAVPAEAAPAAPVADSGSAGSSAASLWDGSAHMPAPGLAIVNSLAAIFCTVAQSVPGSSSICRFNPDGFPIG